MLTQVHTSSKAEGLSKIRKKMLMKQRRNFENKAFLVEEQASVSVEPNRNLSSAIASSTGRP